MNLAEIITEGRRLLDAASCRRMYAPHLIRVIDRFNSTDEAKTAVAGWAVSNLPALLDEIERFRKADERHNQIIEDIYDRLGISKVSSRPFQLFIDDLKSDRDSLSARVQQLEAGLRKIEKCGEETGVISVRPILDPLVSDEMAEIARRTLAAKPERQQEKRGGRWRMKSTVSIGSYRLSVAELNTLDAIIDYMRKNSGDTLISPTTSPAGDGRDVPLREIFSEHSNVATAQRRTAERLQRSGILKSCELELDERGFVRWKPQMEPSR